MEDRGSIPRGSTMYVRGNAAVFFLGIGLCRECAAALQRGSLTWGIAPAC